MANVLSKALMVGFALCNNCHAQTNFNRAHWITYFQERLQC